jgi:hypothetical protein
MFVNVVCLTGSNEFIKIWMEYLFLYFFMRSVGNFLKLQNGEICGGYILFSSCAKVNAIRPSQTFYFADSGMLLLLLHCKVIVI